MKKAYYEEKDIALIGIDKADYVENMYNWANDDEATHFMFTGIRPSNAEKLEQEYLNLVSGDNVVFTIKDKKSGKPIGFVGIYNINWHARHAEFRILIGDSSYRGKDIGTLVTKYVVSYSFEKLNLNKVWLGVNAENKGAIKCYEKAGFVIEGILRREIFRNNRYYDAIRMSILREEYEKRK